MRRAAAVLATVLALLAQLTPPLIASAATTTTPANNTGNPLEKAVSLTETLADGLRKLAASMITVAALVGVIHYAMGRGPEWLGRAVMAAVLLSIVTWVVSYFIG